MNADTTHILYILKRKPNKVVMYGKKKITKHFTIEKFEKALSEKYEFGKFSFEEFDDLATLKHIYKDKLEKYKKRHDGNEPLYNVPSKKLKEVNLSKSLVIPSELLIKMARKAYKFGYRDAKKGNKQELKQLDILIGIKK